MNTHGHAHSMLDLTETHHTQVAMSCLGQTRIGSWNNKGRTFMLVVKQKDSLLATQSSFETGKFVSDTKRVTRAKAFMLMLDALQRQTRSSRRCSGKPVTRLRYRHLGQKKEGDTDW